MRNLDIKAGRLLHLSQGEYSDYHVTGHFVALHDISREVLRQCAVAAAIEVQSTLDDDFALVYEARDRIVPQLVRQGYLLEVDSTEIHLGEYGSFSRAIFDDEEEFLAEVAKFTEPDTLAA